MTKISRRLLDIISFVDKDDSIVDVGCDHGLTSIYLYENKLCKEIKCSDINQNALNMARANILKRNLDIKTYLSDGIKDVDLDNVNALIISGMGTSTILHILSENIDNVNKLIIQSNNDYYLLRKELNSKGFYLEEEKYILDKGKWYVTMKFIRSNKANSFKEIKYGFLKDEDYNNHLLEEQLSIMSKIPIKKIFLKIKTYKNYLDLKKAIKQS